MMPAMPPLQVSASSSASAKSGDGNFSGSTIGIKQGDWNVTTGSGSADGGMKYLIYAALAGAAFWLIKKKSA